MFEAATEVTLVHTDVEESTATWERAPHAMRRALQVHERILRDTLAEHGGTEVRAEGDGFLLAFEDAADATRFCLVAQERLQKADWPAGLPEKRGVRGLRVRMGVHRGVAVRRENPLTRRVDYQGADVHRAERVARAAWGGQVVLTGRTWNAVAGRVEAETQDLGEVHLPGMEGADRLVQALPASLAARGFPPIEATPAWRTNLSARPTSFVGRGPEQEHIDRCYAEGARIVTLLGPGGTGKTRLAERYGLTRLGAWNGGVWFCDLTDARTPDGLYQAVARSLDVPLVQRNPAEQLANAIHARGAVLLVLDNCEQVIAPVVTAARRWLHRAPRAAFLATSREPLGLPEECVVPLEPLEVPPPDLRNLDALAAVESVRLFVDRARAVRDDFELTAENAADVSEIVRQLDGLPLAIELAAARVRILAPGALRQRLVRRFELLTGGQRDLPDRQATLRNTIDWSWDLLTHWEQACFGRAAVFEGGFTEEAAVAVLGVEAWPGAPPVGEVLRGLVSRSLLQQHGPGEGRFGMYVSIHEYAAERLEESGRRGTLEARHARWAARMAVQSMRGWERGDHPRAHDALREEHENMLAAARRAIALPDPDVAWATGLAAARVYRLDGPLERAEALLRRVSTLTGLTARQRITVLTELGHTLHLLGRLEPAAALLRDAQSLSDASATAVPALQLNLGAIEEDRGNLAAAERHVEAGLLLAHEGDLLRLEIQALLGRARVRRRRGSPAAARSDVEAALRLSQQAGDPLDEATVHALAGRFSREEGRLGEAVDQYRAALEGIRTTGDPSREASVLDELAVTLARQGRLDEARTLLERAVVLDRELGRQSDEAQVLGDLGAVLLATDRIGDARRCLQEALAVHRQNGHRRGEADVLATLAEVALVTGDEGGARRYVELALDAAREANAFTAEATVLAVRATLDAEAGRIAEARSDLLVAERLLRQTGARHELAMVLARRGRIEWLHGEAGRAATALARAEELASELEIEPEAPLRTQLEALRREVAAAAG